MKCANCNREALYTYVIAGNHNINYCQSHLPRFLTAQKKAGLLPLVKAPVVETPVKVSKKKETETVVEPEVVEEPAEEETTPTGEIWD
jgi:hypothetical protein